MKTTFGTTAAAIKLAEIVDTNPRSRRYVSSTLSELSSVIHNIVLIRERSVRRYLCMLVQDQYIKRVQENKILTTEETSFLANVITARCRNWKKCFDKTS